MKHLLICLALAVPLTSAAQTPPGPPPSTSTEKMWSKITVQSIKPTLSARNVYAIKGFHANGVSGGWTLESSYQINGNAVQITLAAHAPKGMRTTRHMETIDAKVEIKELTGPAYSGKPGRYDVIVVDHDGKELARTIYEVN